MDTLELSLDDVEVLSWRYDDACVGGSFPPPECPDPDTCGGIDDWWPPEADDVWDCIADGPGCLWDLLSGWV